MESNSPWPSSRMHAYNMKKAVASKCTGRCVDTEKVIPLQLQYFLGTFIAVEAEPRRRCKLDPPQEAAVEQSPYSLASSYSYKCVQGVLVWRTHHHAPAHHLRRQGTWDLMQENEYQTQESILSKETVQGGKHDHWTGKP